MLLDHGLIVEIPDALRQQYCQLWCSFILNDQPTAKAIATQIAGERFMLSLSSCPFGFWTLGPLLDPRPCTFPRSADLSTP